VNCQSEGGNLSPPLLDSFYLSSHSCAGTTPLDPTSCGPRLDRTWVLVGLDCWFTTSCHNYMGFFGLGRYEYGYTSSEHKT